MMRIAGLIFGIVILCPIVATAGSLSTVMVTFKTLSCRGAKGFATVDADRIVKVVSVKCEPNDPVPEVYQVLVTGEPGSDLAYRVFTTSEKEAGRIMKEVAAYQKEKRESIREGDRLIIEKQGR